MKPNKEQISKVQSGRHYNGHKFEDLVFEIVGTKGWIKNTHKVSKGDGSSFYYQTDYYHPEYNWFLEVCTSCKDGKLPKTIDQGRRYRKEFPGSKQLVCLEKVSQKRKSDGYDSHYDRLNESRHIDMVMVGLDELKKFVDSRKIKKKLSPFYLQKMKNENKQIQNKNTGVTMNSNFYLDLGHKMVRESDFISLTSLQNHVDGTKISTSSSSGTGKYPLLKEKGSYFDEKNWLPKYDGEFVSVREFLELRGKDPKNLTFSNFLRSRYSTDMMNKKIKLVKLNDSDIKMDSSGIPHEYVNDII